MPLCYCFYIVEIKGVLPYKKRDPKNGNKLSQNFVDHIWRRFRRPEGVQKYQQTRIVIIIKSINLCLPILLIPGVSSCTII